MKRLFYSLLCWLILCAPTFAAGEFQLLDKSLSGQTLYVLLFSGAGEADAGGAWDGDSWEPLTDTWSTFDIAMTEVSTTGNFLGTMPSIGNKSIRWVIYQDASDDATPDSATDIPIAEGDGYWTGSAFDNADLADLMNLVSSLLPVENDPDRTWVMRRSAEFVGSRTIIDKSDDETVTLWADVSRLLGENEVIGDLADIDVTATGVTITNIAKQGNFIYADFAGGSVDDDPIEAEFSFETDTGTPIVAKGRLRIVD